MTKAELVKAVGKKFLAEYGEQVEGSRIEHLRGPSRWFRTRKFYVYIRFRTTYRIGDSLQHTICVANITIQEKFRGQKIWTRMIEHIHQTNPYPYTYIENVLEERFQHWFLRNGWKPIPRRSKAEPRSFYKATKWHRDG